MSCVLTDRGDRIFYERIGEGPPLVLLPGLTSTGQRFHDNGYVERLSGLFTLLLIDPLGHHRSDKPLDPTAYTMEQCVGHVSAVLDAEGFQQAHVLGFSRGALIAMAFCCDQPDRALSVTLIGWAPTEAMPAINGALEAATKALAAGGWESYFDLFPVPLDNARREMIINLNDPAALEAIGQAVFDASADWSHNAGDVKVPALVIIGGKESWLDATVEDAERAGVPVVVIDGADHAGSFAAIDRVLDAALPLLHLHS